MNNTREAIIAEINLKEKELYRLNIKKGIFTDIVTHHQKTLRRIEKREAEIHNEIEVIKEKVLAWESNKQHEV